jgi:hypothetical protein
MTQSILIKIAAVVAGLAILVATFNGVPLGKGSGLKSAAIALGVAVAAAFILVGIDRFTH